ncbi:MAG: hypothetical protein MUP80_13060 [Acidobacteriia bacterium]|jgi:hypothetical protein|nr:hypothetical protein [Terriglobia bacterium]
MADTRVQLEVEDWVRENWMPSQLGASFSRERLRLTSGGVYDFDAVSVSRDIVAVISTSGARTAGGNLAIGKLHKIRSDILFLMLVEAKRKLVVLTEQDMFDQCTKEREGGRVPREIEFICAEIPQELRDSLVRAREKSSREVRP